LITLITFNAPGIDSYCKKINCAKGRKENACSDKPLGFCIFPHFKELFALLGSWCASENNLIAFESQMHLKTI